MKKPNSISLLGGLLLGCFLSVAPQAIAQKTILKLQYLTSNEVDFGLEAAIGKTRSISASFGIGGKQKWSKERRPGEARSRARTSHVGFSAEFRQYLTNPTQSLQGLYLGAHADLNIYNMYYTEWIKSERVTGFLGTSYYPFTSTEIMTWGRALGLKLGYQKRWKTLTLDLAAGLQEVDTFRESTLVEFDRYGIAAKDYGLDVEGLRWYLSLGLGCAF